MSDDKTKQGLDRKFVAGDEAYEVRHFAERHGISIDQAKKLIDEHGTSREKLDQAARAIKA